MDHQRAMDIIKLALQYEEHPEALASDLAKLAGTVEAFYQEHPEKRPPQTPIERDADFTELQWQVIEWHERGRSVADIADLMNLSPSNVQAIIHRFRACVARCQELGPNQQSEAVGRAAERARVHAQRAEAGAYAERRRNRRRSAQPVQLEGAA